MQLSFVELELQRVLSFPKRVLGTKLWSSPRTVSALNSKTMSPHIICVHEMCGRPRVLRSQQNFIVRSRLPLSVWGGNYQPSLLDFFPTPLLHAHESQP